MADVVIDVTAYAVEAARRSGSRGMAAIVLAGTKSASRCWTFSATSSWQELTIIGAFGVDWPACGRRCD
jgi:hypothetical protein